MFFFKILNQSFHSHQTIRRTMAGQPKGGYSTSLCSYLTFHRITRIDAVVAPKQVKQRTLSSQKVFENNFESSQHHCPITGELSVAMVVKLLGPQAPVYSEEMMDVTKH